MNVYAQNLIPCPDGTQADPGVGCVGIPDTLVNPESPLLNLILNIANYLVLTAGGLAIIFLIYGAIRYATAVGQQDRIDQAKRTLFWSLAGLILSILASALVQFILNLL